MRPGDVRVMARQDRLAREERDQHRRQHQDERDEREDDRFRPEHRQALRDGGECGPDHSRRVLGADHEDAEDADCELCDLRPDQRGIKWVEAGALGRTLMAPVRRDHGRGEDRETDREHRGDEERPARRADAAQLRPLGDDYARLSDLAAESRAGNRDGGHAASSPAVANSSSPRVRSMKASSSDA